MGNAITKLTKFANDRRKNSLRGFVSELSAALHTHDEHVTECSDFYKACRDNQVDVVKRLIKNMSLEEIDRKEPNGSTALHAACYFGHYEIVQLLLESGADRAVQNKYECLPFDEAANDKIKELFYRIPSSNRLVSNTGSIEWVLIDGYPLEDSVEEKGIIKSIYDNAAGATTIQKMFERIEKNYIEKGLKNFQRIEHIKRYFRQATQENDPRRILQAYTAETDFYKVFNKEMASGATTYQSERRYIIALLRHHPILEELSYTGSTYRFMIMNYDEINNYKVGSSFMLKTLVSSSINRELAELFMRRYEKFGQQPARTLERFKMCGKPVKRFILCVYQIKHHRSALNIENCSQYPCEGEVLLMPYTVFTVRGIQESRTMEEEQEYIITELMLEELDNYGHQANVS